MLTIYRRHSKDCQHFEKPRHARGSKVCKCPIWVQGTLNGEYKRESLSLTSWEAAQNLIRDWEAGGQFREPKPQIPTVQEAVQSFLADCEARHLKPSYTKKLKQLLEGKLLAFCKAHGFRLLRQLDVAAVRRFRATWSYKPIPAKKRLEYLRSFMSFCQGSGWVSTNPAKAVKAPKPRPVLGGAGGRQTGYAVGRRTGRYRQSDLLFRQAATGQYGLA